MRLNETAIELNDFAGQQTILGVAGHASRLVVTSLPTHCTDASRALKPRQR